MPAPTGCSWPSLFFLTAQNLVGAVDAVGLRGPVANLEEDRSRCVLVARGEGGIALRDPEDCIGGEDTDEEGCQPKTAQTLRLVDKTFLPSISATSAGRSLPIPPMTRTKSSLVVVPARDAWVGVVRWRSSS